MKNLFFTLFFAFLLVQVAQAQIQSAFEVHPNPSDTITASDLYDSPAHGEIMNVSPNPVNIRWERTEVFLTPNVTTAVCDPVTCWFQGVSTKQFQLLKDSMGQMTVHFYNNAYDPAPGQAGSGIVHLKLTNLDNLSDTMTVVYTYSTLTATNNLPDSKVKLFPNPTTDYFTLEDAHDVVSMRLFSLDGRIVARFDASADNTYQIGHLPAGNYVLSFEDKNGNLFRAVELNKR